MLRRGVREPALTLRGPNTDEGMGSVASVAFNPAQRESIAAAQGGRVHVWALPHAVTRRVGADRKVAAALSRGEAPPGVLRAGMRM